MPTQPTIRAAMQEDIPAILALLQELSAAEGGTAAMEADALAHAMFGDTAPVRLRAFVAEQGGRIVGTLLYYAGYDTLSTSNGHHLADMCVTHTHRRHGIGRALFLALAEQTLQENKQWVSLTALRRNAHAQAFYASLGMGQMDVNFYAIGMGGLRALGV